MSMVRAFALCCALACAAGAVRAHDSWLVPDPQGGLALSTGARYPVADIATVHAPVTCARQSCWVQTGEAQIDLPPDRIEVYLREIRPSAEVLRRWDAMRAAGLPWHERYRKFARIEFAGATAASRAPTGAPLEIVASGTAPMRAQQPASFRVLAYGRPVAGLAVELVSERSGRGEWAQSDIAGRLSVVPVSEGPHILRATWLDADGDAWSSRFVTFAFTALPDGD